MKEFYGKTKLGILGGGQLGRMLMQEAINFNISTYILDPDKNAPCKFLCENFVVGALTDYDTVYNFGKACDVITIEIEKVNVEALIQLEKEGKEIYPQPHIIKIIQDKGLQKEFYLSNNIPTAKFKLIDDIFNEKFEFPFVQKQRKDGYDGKGVMKMSKESDLLKAFTAPSLIEELVPFEKEIAVIVSRNISGQVKTFPTVEMEFHPVANLVELQISPARISIDIHKKAEKIAVDIAQGLKIVGTLAVEMFLCKDGEILVNEIAPRPHNSGHQSIEGNSVSQFAQHLRCIFDMPLSDTSTLRPAVMINLLGEEKFEGEAIYEGLEEALKIEGVYVHLYGKKITKPFRKMGHVTVVNLDIDTAIATAKKIKNILKVKA